MIDDFAGGQPPRKKPKIILPLEKPAQTPLHELVAKEDATFQTPEEVAKTEIPADDAPVVSHHSPEKVSRLHRLLPRTKRQRIISGGVAIVLAFAIGAGWTLTHHKRAVQAVAPLRPATKKVVLPPVIYSTLSGLPVADASVNQRPVTGVMVENSLGARPQSGLSQAGVVFEALAEGGVTRFLAMYQDQTPGNVGPIRSARPYFIQWNMGFDAAYAHVGGSPLGLQDITAWGVQDMNQFYNGNYFHRITSRYAPHNVYTGIVTLNQLEAAKGYTSTYTGFPRKKEQPYKAPAAAPASKTKTPAAPADSRTPANSIDLSLSGPIYNPHYDYNATTNSYDRSEGGAPHVDANSGAQLSPKVVIAMIVPEVSGPLDSSGAYYSDYSVVGSGAVYVFQDGTVTTGTWSKTDMKSQITFTDSAGQPILLNPGQTWITAVSSTDQVSYK